MARISIHPSALLFAVLTPMLLVAGCQPATSDSADKDHQQGTEVVLSSISGLTEQVDAAPDCRNLLPGPWRMTLRTDYTSEAESYNIVHSYQGEASQHITCTLDAGLSHESGTLWGTDMPEGVTLILDRDNRALIYIDTQVGPGTRFGIQANRSN